MADETKFPERTSRRRLRLWDPFDLFERMAPLWDETWLRATRLPMRSIYGIGRDKIPWAPRVDVFEQKGTLVIQAELPGVKKEDLSVEIDQGNLIIRGKREAQHEVKEEDYYRTERSYGSFYRSIPLPFDVEPDQVNATFVDGVLEIRIPEPLPEQPEPRKIPVG